MSGGEGAGLKPVDFLFLCGATVWRNVDIGRFPGRLFVVVVGLALFLCLFFFILSEKYLAYRVQKETVSKGDNILALSHCVCAISPSLDVFRLISPFFFFLPPFGIG